MKQFNLRGKDNRYYDLGQSKHNSIVLSDTPVYFTPKITFIDEPLTVDKGDGGFTIKAPVTFERDGGGTFLLNIMLSYNYASAAVVRLYDGDKEIASVNMVKTIGRGHPLPIQTVLEFTFNHPVPEFNHPVQLTNYLKLQMYARCGTELLGWMDETGSAA